MDGSVKRGCSGLVYQQMIPAVRISMRTGFLQEMPRSNRLKIVSLKPRAAVNFPSCWLLFNPCAIPVLSLSGLKAWRSSVKTGSAELNMEDAKQLHIESGEMITITSSRGAITLPSKITERTPPGRVLVPYHFDQLKVNVLTDTDNPLTPVSVKKA